MTAFTTDYLSPGSAPPGDYLVALGDTGDFARMNNFARDTAWLHGIAEAYAKYGVVLFAVFMLTGWWHARGHGDVRIMARALLTPVAMLIAVAVNQPIVHAVDEPRPYTRLPDALVLVQRSADASFPSDHAVMAGAVAAGLLLVSRRLGVIATVAALLMAFIRVYVGAHYPIDVLAGLAVGAGVATLVILAASAPVERLVCAALTTPLRVLLTDPGREMAAPRHRHR